MIQNGATGDSNGQNINTKWFTDGEYLWRTGASIAWLLLCLPGIVLVFTFAVSVSVFHPITWFTDVFSTLFALYFWITVVLYGIFTGLLAFSNNKFNTVQDVVYKNRISWMLYLLHPSRLFHMFLYSICGMFSAWCLLSIIPEPYDSLTTFKSQSNDECFLNENGVFTITFAGWLSFYASLQYFIKKEFHFTFPAIQQRKLFRFKADIWPCVKKSVTLTLKAVKYYYPLYYFFGSISKAMFASFLVLTPDRDAAALNSLSGLFNLYLLWVVLCLGSLLTFVWRLGNTLFVIYNTEALQFTVESPVTHDKDQCLPMVIKTKAVPLLTYLAFLDLCQLSQFSIKRRKQIFCLTQPGGRPANWTSVSEECISMLNTLTTNLNVLIEYQTYQRQHNAEPWMYRNLPIPTNLGSLTQPTLTSPTISPPTGTPNNAALPRPTLWSSHQENVSVRQRNGASPMTTTMPQEKAIGHLNKKVNLLQWRIQQIPHNFARFMRERPVIGFLFNEIPGARAEELFADCQLYIWAVQGLSSLVVASFSEDTFGVVQKNLSDILTSLLSLLQSLDRYAKFPAVGQQPTIQPRPPRLKGKEGMCYNLRTNLVSSIYNITNTFGQHLNGIPLTPDHWSRLQAFLDYREAQLGDRKDEKESAKRRKNNNSGQMGVSVETPPC